MSANQQKTASEVLKFTDDLVDGTKTTNDQVLQKYDEWADEYDQVISLDLLRNTITC